MKHKWTYFIDASTTRTGITLLRDDEKKVIVTHLNFSNIHQDRQLNKQDNQIIKFREIKKKLDEFTKKYPLTQKIYIEGIFVKPTFLNSSEVLIKFHGFLILYFIDYNLNYFAPKSIKKIVTGNGNANKKDVREILETKYRIEFNNDDQSDAFAVMECWLQKNEKIIDRKIVEVIYA